MYKSDNTEKKNNNRYLIAVILMVILFVIQFLSSRLGWFVAQFFDFSVIDKDGLFAEVTVHHIVQMIFALVVIFFLWKFKKIHGFNLAWKYDPKGVKYTVIFCAALFVYYLVTYVIGSFTNTINTYDYELTPVNVLGTLGFQLLLSGPSEEILFRSLPIVLLLRYLDPDSRKDRIISIVIAAFLFGAAHINVFTFVIPWFQVCYAFVLGLAYGYVFIRTKSVIYPMIMHSMSNVISVGGCYIYMMLVG